MRRTLPTLLAAFALVVAAASSAQGTDAPTQPLDLPELGEPADASLSPGEETRLRHQVEAELFGGDFLVDDAEITDYITTVGWKLAARASANPPDFSFHVIADPRINAFAVPGGLIGINAGLIMAADNESELAGVIGHEEAHVTQRHLARTANDTKTANLATWGLMLAAILAGSANPDLILGALAVGQGVNYQRQVNYTRSHEQEADRIGIQTMAQAGYDPEAMASFFGKLEQQTRLYGAGPPEILRTHPVNTSRIAEARARAARMPRVTVRESNDFAFIKARTEVLLAERPGEAVDLFAGRLANGLKNGATAYGYAFALERAGRAEEALPVLAPVLQAQPKQVQVNLLQARLLAATGDVADSQALLAQQLALYPRSGPVILARATGLLEAGDAEGARRVLLAHEPAHGGSIERHRLLAEAARAQGNIAETQFQMASYSEARGDLREAIGQLQAGLRLNTLTGQDRRRLQSFRDEIIAKVPRGELAEMERQGRR